MKLAANLLKYLPLSRTAAAEPGTPAAMPAPLMLALEPRIVYDASAAAIGTTAGAAAAPQHHADADTHHTESAVAQPSAATTDASTAASGGAATQAQAQPRATHGFMEANVAAPEKQVVFIDPSVANYQQLLAGLPASTQYVILNPNGDGLAQIAQYLQQHPGVDAIHLVSHGENGAIQVGATWLTDADVSAYSGELAQIGAAMKPGGDFLIYGCDVAENADGKTLVQQIASASHLNVAASTDATGAAALGGNWTLEYDVGTVHTPVIFSAVAEQQFSGLLGVTDETYDSHVGFVTSGGVTGVTSFSLDGITYTTDQAVETAVDSYTVNQGYQVPLTSSSAPNNGVLFGNVQGASLTSLTMSLQNGDKMAVQSFDIDIGAPSRVTIEALDASGSIIGTYLLDSSPTGSNNPTFHVNLASNAAFASVKSLKIVETDGYFLTPTLDNFTYVDLSSPPVMTSTGGSTSFVEADNTASTPVLIDSGITLTDGDATTAKQGTVSITGNFAGAQDVLAFMNTSPTLFGDITSSYSASTGVLTLTSASGTATILQWQNAFHGVTYTDTAAMPSTATRTVSFTLTSDAFSTSSNTVQKSVTVTATDQTPIVTTTGGTTSYRSGTTATTIDTHVTVSDSDNTTQASGTVSVSTGFHSGDTLSFTNTSATTFGNISGSYDAATGVLTLTSSGATATDAQWASALSAVAFSSTSTTYGNRTIAFATNDGTKTSAAATDTVNVTNAVLVTTDTGSAAFAAGDNTVSTPVAVDSTLTVGDTVSTTLGSATVAITRNFHSGEDVLSFLNTSATTFGNIAGSYNATTGVLTLTSAGATATVAQWQSALDAVKYTDTAVTPNTAPRTISFTAVDGGGNTSNTATRTVTVTATDQTPIVTTTGGTTSYVGGTAATTIDSGITVSDLDNPTQASAAVSIGTGFHSGDTLAFTNTSATLYGNITASYNAATGVLTLTSSGATATDAQWASALSAVGFSSTSTTYGNRTIAFTTNDGTKTSVAATDTITMTAPPTVTTDAGAAAFVAGDNTASTPVVIDSGLSVTDGSSTTLGSATVAITGNFHSGEDVLSFLNTSATTFGNIAGAYNATTGVLTLTSAGATATLAQWQAALDAVKYTDTAVTPNTATRTISFTAVDGGGNTSNTATRTVTVTATDQTPIVTTTGGTTSYVGGTSSTTIDGGITVSDLDNATLSSATVSITTGFHNGDVLWFVNTGTISGSYNAATGVLTLTASGGATLAQWQSALSSVQFSSSSTTYGNRTISFAVNDGTKTSAVATDTVGVLGPPQITTDPGAASFVAGDNTSSTPVVIDAGLSVTDGTSTTLASATVAITGNFHSGEDVVSFANTSVTTFGNITGSYNATTGVLTLTSAGATATLAQWQSALESVKYTDTAVTPNMATRTVSFTIVDSGGNTSNTATRTVTVMATDQTPIVTSTGGTTSYRSGTAATAIDSHITVSDLDNATQASATVSIGVGFQSGDTLGFTNTSATAFGNITASYNSATGVLTLTSAGATANDAQWANALSAVTFFSTSTSYGDRTISFATSDGTKTSAAVTSTITVTNPLQVVTDTGSTAFVEADNATSTPVAIDSGVTISDTIATAVSSATVSITGNFHSGEDVLSFTNDGATMGNISASYDAATGVLTLTSAGGTASLAQWQSALDSVKYTDTSVSVAPNTQNRTMSFTFTDRNGNTSDTATRTVTVAATDQTPIVTAGGAASYVGGTVPVIVDSHITVSDLDNPTLPSATVSIGSGFHDGDTLAFSNTNATSFGNIVASYNATTGVLTLTSAGASASDAQWANALSSVTFASTRTTGGDRTISFVASDGMKTSAVATSSIHVAAPQTTTQTTPQAAANTANMGETSSLPAKSSSSISGVSSETLSVLQELDPPSDVGGMPTIPTITFSDPRAPQSFAFGRTSVPGLASIVPPEVSDGTDGLNTIASVFMAPSLVVRADPAHGGAFSISLSSVLSGVNGQLLTTDVAAVDVRLADGASLPAWLRYDHAEGILSGALPSGSREVRVVVQARDANGHVIRREIVFAPNAARAAGAMPRTSAPHASRDSADEPLAQTAQLAPLTVSKPSLAHQFAHARAAFHVARPAAVPPAAFASNETRSRA